MPEEEQEVTEPNNKLLRSRMMSSPSGIMMVEVDNVTHSPYETTEKVKVS